MKSNNQEPKMTDVFDIKNFNVLKDGQFDGCYFKQSQKPEEPAKVNFQFLKWNEMPLCEISPHTGFYNYIIILSEKLLDLEGIENPEEIRAIVYYHAYLGNPLQFVRNQAKIGSEGLVIKKSHVGYLLAQKILGTTGADMVQSKLNTDLIQFQLENGLVK